VAVPKKRARRGGPKPGFKLSAPRRSPEQFPTTDMVPDSVRGNAQRGAWKKGWEAAQKGRTPRSNPYSTESATYARGLHRLWMEGFNAIAGA
jgi:hypothetical protein